MITQFYDFVLLDAKNVDEGLKNVTLNEARKKASNSEELLFFFVSMDIGHYINFKTVKNNLFGIF